MPEDSSPWLPPLWRVALGVLAGVALFVLHGWLERGPRWTDVLVGAAVALLAIAVTYGPALLERRRRDRQRS